MKHTILTHNPKKPSAGFSLIEMLVVLAIIGIIAAIAIPAWHRHQETTANQQIHGTANPTTKVVTDGSNVDTNIIMHAQNLVTAGNLLDKQIPRNDLAAVMNAVLKEKGAPETLRAAIENKVLTVEIATKFITLGTDGNLHLISSALTNGTATNMKPANGGNI